MCVQKPQLYFVIYDNGIKAKERAYRLSALRTRISEKKFLSLQYGINLINRADMMRTLCQRGGLTLMFARQQMPWLTTRLWQRQPSFHSRAIKAFYMYDTWWLRAHIEQCTRGQLNSRCNHTRFVGTTNLYCPHNAKGRMQGLNTYSIPIPMP